MSNIENLNMKGFTLRPATWAATGVMTLLIVSGFAGAAMAHPGGGGPSFQGSCTVVVATENLANDAVQLAINAASSGSTICVGSKGTTIFPEQITIAKPLTLLGLIVDQNVPTVTTFQPTALSTTTHGLDPYAGLGSPQDPIILVKGTQGVTIMNLFVDGSKAIGSVSGGCSDPRMIGIDVQDASATIDSVVVENTAQPTSLFGCQTSAGLGINVESSASGGSAVTVTNSIVESYQKNGITCVDVLTSCTITQTTVSGIGQTTLTAQNGIEIGDGASANINHALIADNSYAVKAYPTENCGDYASFTGYSASGILLYDSGPVNLNHNEVDQNDIGIAAFNDGAEGPVSAVQMNHNVLGGSYESGSYCQGIVFDGVSGHAVQDQINPASTSTYSGTANVPDGFVVAASYAPASVMATHDGFGAFPAGALLYDVIPPATLDVH